MNPTNYVYDRQTMTVTKADGKAVMSSYEYDLRNRLLKETKKDKTSEEIYVYRYDWNGNQLQRLWEKFETGKGRTEPGRVSFAKKKAGEVVICERRAYNGLNQLTSLYQDSEVTKYRYRPDGLRLCKEKADGSETGHIWDGSEMVAEYQANGNIIARYLRGINLIARELDGQQEYYLHNAHGDVVQRTDRYGTPLKSYDYDAFGNEEKPEELDHNPWRYCGEYLDLEIQNYYLRARCYEPRIGRFTTEDVAHDGLNWYTYCGNNPILYIDPLGLKSYIFYDPYGDGSDDSSKAYSLKTAKLFQQQLAKHYNIKKSNIDTEIVLYALTDYNEFKKFWNNTMESDLDAILFNAHSIYSHIQITKDPNGNNTHTININDVANDLDYKVIDALYLMGCEPGAPNGGNSNIAQAFWDKMDIMTMFAADAKLGISRYTEHAWYDPFKWGEGTEMLNFNINTTSSVPNYTPQGMLMWNSSSNGVPVPLRDPFKPTFVQLANLTK